MIYKVRIASNSEKLRTGLYDLQVYLLKFIFIYIIFIYLYYVSSLQKELRGKKVRIARYKLSIERKSELCNINSIKKVSDFISCNSDSKPSNCEKKVRIVR